MTEIREITLTQNKVAIVDEPDYVWLTQFKWHARKDKTTWYAQYGSGKQGIVQMHRLITGCPPEQIVDHIDGNGLNNQRSNLRICSHGQNMRNQRPRQGTASKYKGVTWSQYHNKWCARIYLNGTYTFLGYFFDEIGAALAYNAAAPAVFGEFAHLNQISAERDLS